MLKLVHFVGEASELRAALGASARKIIVFLGAVMTVVLIVGSIMYLVEGEKPAASPAFPRGCTGRSSR